MPVHSRDHAALRNAITFKALCNCQKIFARSSFSQEQDLLSQVASAIESWFDVALKSYILRVGIQTEFRIFKGEST